jgi:PDZ domain
MPIAASRLITAGVLAGLMTCRLPAAPPPAWSESILRLEAHSPQGGTRLSAAVAVSPELLAAILPSPPREETWRAAGADVTQAVKLLVRDEPSGFTLFAPVAANATPWKPLPLPEAPILPLPGAVLQIPGSPDSEARCAGRDILFQAQLLENPWLRVHLPPGSWTFGTPLAAEGRFAGLLAAPVPGMPDAARLFPAQAVQHFVRLYTERRPLTRPFLGLRLENASALPLVRECHVAGPAERAGVQPGDVLLRIGNRDLTSATDAVEACFYLRVDEEVTIRVLRATSVVEVKVRPVDFPPPAPAEIPGR